MRWAMSHRVETDWILLGASLFQTFIQIVSLAVLLILGDFDGYGPLELFLGSLNVDSCGCC